MTTEPRIVGEVGIIAYSEAQLAAIYGLGDLFRVAGEQSALAGEEPARAIRVTHWRIAPSGGVEVAHDSHPGAPHAPTYLIAPPSLIMPDRMAPVDGFAPWLLARHQAGAVLCSICAGAFVIAETGLLDGRTATTHWAFVDSLARRFPKIRIDIDRMIIDEGDIITAGGMLAWTDLGLTLVERWLGRGIMLETARFMLSDPPGRTQQPYGAFVQRLDHGDAAILKVQHWLQTTGAKAHSVTELADIAGLEERTFFRRFRKATGLRPTEYAQHVRVAKAREALELSRLPVDQIAWDVGYADASAFRKVFQRVTGLSPADYRRRFGLAA